MAAIYQTTDRQRIRDNIRAYFKPTPIRPGPMQALGANFLSDLRHDDKDPSGLQTATYDSLERFLRDNGLVKDGFVVKVGDAPRAMPPSQLHSPPAAEAFWQGR